MTTTILGPVISPGLVLVTGGSGYMAGFCIAQLLQKGWRVRTTIRSLAKAEQVRQKLLAMQKDYLIEMGDAVIAVKDAQGRIKLNQLINTTATGAISGAFWGTLIGLIFLMPLAGAAVGAASGALGGALNDVGINDKWMKETAAAIEPGTAALFVLVRKATGDKVLEGLKGESIIRTNLDDWRQKLLHEPWIREASLRRSLPSTVEVVIAEREPIGLCRIDRSLYLVDDQGVLIDEYGPQYADLAIRRRR